jgi:hypothetical protein
MSAGIYDIVIEQGGDYALQFVVKDDGVPRDLTGYSARAMMRQKYSDVSPVATFTCSLPDAANGVVKAELHNSVTKDLTPGRYKWDIELYTSGDSVVFPILKGKAEVRAEATK